MWELHTLGGYVLLVLTRDDLYQEYITPKSVQLQLWGLRRQNFTSRDEPVHIICTLCMIDTGLYETQLWVQLSCDHFALFASVTF